MAIIIGQNQEIAKAIASSSSTNLLYIIIAKAISTVMQ
jgi:hypothetical protein